MVAMESMDDMDRSISKKEGGVEGMDEMDWMDRVEGIYLIWEGGSGRCRRHGLEGGKG